MSFSVPYLGGDGKTITPNQISSLVVGENAQVFMYCPDQSCRSAFIAYYEFSNPHREYIYLGKVTRGTISNRSFSAIINQKSKQFSLIYNQAHEAEQTGLTEICGVGYRKALEFLIKDYCVSNHPTKQDEIEGKLLMAVINEFVSDPRIKAVAQRATWLGNDETHYIRRWQDQNLDALKTLVELTIHWVEAEELTKNFQDSMPAKK